MASFLTGFGIAGSVLWASYLANFALAYAAGILFQYSAIAPMRHLSGWAGIRSAAKAESVSLIAFELGMFAWMASTHELLFEPALTPLDSVYWFMDADCYAHRFSKLTAYPANLWLIRKKA